MNRRQTFILGLLAVCVSCSSAADPGPFKIIFDLNTESGGCESTDCADYAMSCNTTLLIRIINAESGQILGSLCESISPDKNLCSLRNLSSGNLFLNLPTVSLRIEVAAWNTDTLNQDPDAVDNCPDRNLFDLAGHPLEGITPQPAFAGATYFDASSTETAVHVPLSCPDPKSLNTVDCAPAELLLVAQPIDLENPPALDDEAALSSGLLVRATSVHSNSGQGNAETEIDNTRIVTLSRNDESPTFSALVLENELTDPICVLTLEQTPEATTAITCDKKRNQRGLDLATATIPKATLDQILAALALPTFPRKGLVIGRVYDELTGSPLAGVKLRPESGETVLYLTSGRDGLLETETSLNGYFIATDVDFGTPWTARADDMVATSSLKAGLVKNTLSLLQVPMRDTSGL